ncbi:hypothetical protein CEUSTIGMA_g6996.t1 [Chlamydomonas eustigma]|uniref:Uncharacterized protein n=1 Tax=Chlamydomonas eustigma TaxID=1157962 RepID=A0A250X900_9CHLO|nr:hypothetical protein CEUSTIGMA_g6996.t1 [Chlamydomonas eustigma]|eukprot:GAX79555.1 hypothetical protein CEUSTIGMA_g6996.t1 [Chlamydomonas eustigma]
MRQNVEILISILFFLFLLFPVIVLVKFKVSASRVSRKGYCFCPICVGHRHLKINCSEDLSRTLADPCCSRWSYAIQGDSQVETSNSNAKSRTCAHHNQCDSAR